jgi:hypothetical protein
MSTALNLNVGWNVQRLNDYCAEYFHVETKDKVTRQTNNLMITKQNKKKQQQPVVIDFYFYYTSSQTGRPKLISYPK